MSTCIATIDSPTPEVRPALAAWSIGFALVLVVIGAGLMRSMPLPTLGWAAAFLFFAVASDVRSHRVPNLLTIPALLGALVVSPWMGGTSGPLEAATGAALGFALLIGPYAVGGMGAGDVKALMALGAWTGAATIAGATAWAIIAAGSFGIASLALRRELGSFARRWGRNIGTTLTLRRLAYEAPAPGTHAAGGIPFAAALAVGLAAQWYGGSPW